MKSSMPAGTEFHRIFLDESTKRLISSVSRMSFAMSSSAPAIKEPKRS